MGRIRIAYFIDHLKVGGAQRHLIDLVRGLDRDRFDPQVWLLRRDGHLVDEIEALEIPVQTVGVRNRLIEANSAWILGRVSRQLRRDRVKIVHTYLSDANVVGAVASMVARIPILLVSKRSLDRYAKRSQRWTHYIVNCLSDRVVANAQAIKDFVVRHEGCPVEKIVVIPNGIKKGATPLLSNGQARAMRQSLGLGPSEHIVGTIGRLVWKKGHEHFLEAASTVLRQEPNTTFVMVGDGPRRRELEQYAQDLGIAQQVRFLGQRVDTQKLLSIFDTFVLPSVIEGMPNALLEALAASRPVVVTDVGGNGEIVTDGQTGIIVPPRDPLVMAESIIRLLRDRDLARQLGLNGAHFVTEHFHFDRTLDAMQSLYEEVLSENGIEMPITS